MSGTLVATIDNVEKVAELVNRGWKPGEIARHLNLKLPQVKKYISEYQEYLARRVEEDPEFLDRIQNNTLEALDRLDSLIKEAWETYDTAKAESLINQQINLLKVAGQFEQQRANLLQLMGAKIDGGMNARMQKAERVNEIVSSIIKEVVSQCDHCKVEVMPRLAEAFAMMNREEEAADMRPVNYEEDDIVDADVVEEEDDHDQDAMMANVIALD